MDGLRQELEERRADELFIRGANDDPRMINVEIYARALRKINRNALPLPHATSDQIIDAIKSSYARYQGAFDFLEKYSEKYALYDASIIRIAEALTAYYIGKLEQSRRGVAVKRKRDSNDGAAAC